MNYCINLKKRKNKPYCKLLDKEITLSRCRECDNKEYRSKNQKIKKNAQSREKEPNKKVKMHNK